MKTMTGLLAAVLLLAGCGGDDGGGDDGEEAAAESDAGQEDSAPSDDPAVVKFCEDAMAWETAVAGAMNPSDPEARSSAGDNADQLREIEAPEAVAGSWDLVVNATADYLEAMANAGPAMDKLQDAGAAESLDDIDFDSQEDKEAVQAVMDAQEALRAPDLSAAGEEVSQFIGSNCDRSTATPAPAE